MVLTSCLHVCIVVRNMSGSVRLPSPQSELSAYNAGIMVGQVCVTYCPPLAIQVHLQTPTVA